MKPVRSFWKKARVLLLIFLVLFIAIQFVRPPLENPPVTADLNAPREVKAILRRACYDCHSNETKIAWFDWPVPAWWMVVKDVKEGRKVLNFSAIDSLPKGQQAAKLFESIMQVEQQAMPIPAYAALHHGARVSEEEMAVLKKYALTLGYHPKMDTARERAAAEQYEAWTGGMGPAMVNSFFGKEVPDFAERMKKGHAKTAMPPDEYNGIAYGPLAGFSDWTAVSTTERYDNGTLRLILGNDVAVKAIRGGHTGATGAWPDGAVFAKVAWDQVLDTAGELRAGAFKQVEFMIRDSKKYASSFGWGFARWVGGLGLKPYGKDAGFVEECMNCHRPLKATDYTFTFPLADTMKLDNRFAYLPDSLDGYPLRGKVITTLVNPREGTMSTLYGNDAAVKAAQVGMNYYPGAFYALVTWSQREDPHWFGGRIPKEMLKVETVYYTAGGEEHWRGYEGIPLKGVEMKSDRAAYITRLKASVMP